MRLVRGKLHCEVNGLAEWPWGVLKKADSRGSIPNLLKKKKKRSKLYQLNYTSYENDVVKAVFSSLQRHH